MPFTDLASPSRWVGSIVSSGHQSRVPVLRHYQPKEHWYLLFVSAMKPLPPVFQALGQDQLCEPSLRFRDILRGIRVDRGAFRRGVVFGLLGVPALRSVVGYDLHELASLFDNLCEIGRETEFVVQRVHELRPSLYELVQLPLVDSIDAQLRDQCGPFQ